MSIGEVLAILKPEFPDITVSKIRFLEGAGLVQPDRSASGYRMFSDDDVARLRFILRAQRDQYLPLRVIRQRLADLEQVGGLYARGGSLLHGPAPGSPDPAAAGGPGVPTGTRPAPSAPGRAGAGAGTAPAAAGRRARTRSATGAALPNGAAASAEAGTAAAGTGGPEAGARLGLLGSGAHAEEAQFSREELCRAAGTSVEALAELESFGLLGPRGAGERGSWYNGEDLLLLRVARDLSGYGIQARHLRMYKTFAEREASLIEQVVAPLVRQRNPEARSRVRETIEALAELGSRMRDLALRAAVQGLADGHDFHR
jgi:DNA-binding transcriptional MerR regulator